MIAFRFITGFAVGFDILPDDEIYLILYLGIFEVLFASNKLIESLE
jgi:hypothetical protein